MELAGSESFVNRQLLLLASYLDHVDQNALEGLAVREAPVPIEPVPAPAPTPVEAPPGVDGLVSFYRENEPAGQDRQADSALLFAYYLQRHEGLESLPLRDLIRCCIRAGVDTRNFNRTLGALTRRGLLETLRHGRAYRLSEQGVVAVEQRMA